MQKKDIIKKKIIQSFKKVSNLSIKKNHIQLSINKSIQSKPQLKPQNLKSLKP